MPFCPTRRIKDCVSSSTVSLKASDGVWPCLAKDVVLRFHHTCQRAHKHTALAGEVAVDFILEGGREQITRADGNPQRDRAFIGAPGRILLNGKAGIDAGAIQEVGAHAAARSLRGNQRHIHMRRRDNTGLIFVCDGKAM